MALILASYSAHAHPAPEGVQRVSDAVERSVSTQLKSPAKWASASCVLIAGLGAWAALARDLPLLWPLLVPLLVALGFSSSLYIGARVIHRGVAQSVSMPTPHLALTHGTRSTLAALTITGATTSILNLGAHTFLGGALGTEGAELAVLSSSLTIAFISMLFARAAATSALTVHHGTKEAQLDPHGGSLAALVSSSFHTPLLWLCAWSTLSSLGHTALLLSAPGGGELWLYPHLVQLLGLLALVFGAWTARMAEGETAVHAWIRSAVVTVTLVIGGLWSLGSRLPSTAARVVPFGLTVFFVALAIAAWVSPRNPEASPSVGLSPGRLLAPFAFSALVLVLGGALLVQTRAQLNADHVARLLCAAALAALPLAILWILTSQFDRVKHQIARLAFIEAAVGTRSVSGGLARWVGFLPVLGGLVLICSVEQFAPSPAQHSTLLLFAFAAAWGLLASALVGTMVSSLPRSYGSKLKPLVEPNDTEAAALDLEAAGRVCAEAIGSKTSIWLACAVAPALACVLLRQLLADPNSTWACWGIALGVGLGGTAQAFRSSQSTLGPQRMFGTMCLITSLAQVLLIFAVMNTIQ